VLLVPDGGSGYPEPRRDIFLVETEFETTASQVVTDSDKV